MALHSLWPVGRKADMGMSNLHDDLERMVRRWRAKSGRPVPPRGRLSRPSGKAVSDWVRAWSLAGKSVYHEAAAELAAMLKEKTVR